VSFSVPSPLSSAFRVPSPPCHSRRAHARPSAETRHPDLWHLAQGRRRLFGIPPSHPTVCMSRRPGFLLSAPVLSASAIHSALRLGHLAFNCIISLLSSISHSRMRRLSHHHRAAFKLTLPSDALSTYSPPISDISRRSPLNARRLQVSRSQVPCTVSRPSSIIYPLSRFTTPPEDPVRGEHPAGDSDCTRHVFEHEDVELSNGPSVQVCYRHT